MNSLTFKQGSSEYKTIEDMLSRLAGSRKDITSINITATKDNAIIVFKHASDEDTFEGNKRTVVYSPVLIKAAISKEMVEDGEDYIEDITKDQSYYEDRLKKDIISDLSELVDSGMLSSYSIDEVDLREDNNVEVSNILFYFYCTLEAQITAINEDDDFDILADKEWAGILDALLNYDITLLGIPKFV